MLAGRKDSDALVVEAVTDAGEVTVRFFGGTRVLLQVSPENARMLRRLIPAGGGLHENSATYT